MVVFGQTRKRKRRPNEPAHIGHRTPLSGQLRSLNRPVLRRLALCVIRTRVAPDRHRLAFQPNPGNPSKSFFAALFRIDYTRAPLVFCRFAFVNRLTEFRPVEKKRPREERRHWLCGWRNSRSLTESRQPKGNREGMIFDFERFLAVRNFLFFDARDCSLTKGSERC